MIERVPNPSFSTVARPAVRDAVYDLMRRFGMTSVFGNPGSTELPMFRNFPNDFRYVLGLQEATVVGMADGYAQVTGNAAMVNLHSAAGLGNAMGNIFTSFKNQTPLVITAGQQARSILPFDPFLASDQATELAKPYVKWSIEPARAEDVPLALARAYYLAMLPPRGPVLVSVPADDWDRPSGYVAMRTVATELAAEPGMLERIAKALDASERPALVVGPGVDRDGAWNEVIALAERLIARVFASPMTGRCSFPEDHPLFAGAMPAMREKIVKMLAGHDVILVLGAPAFKYHVEGEGPHVPEGSTLCQIVDDPKMAAWTPAGLAAVGNVRLAAIDLLARLVTRTRPQPPAREAKTDPAASSPMSVAYVLDTLQQMRDPQTIIVEEAPSARPAVQRYLPITRSAGFFSMDSGGLGYGMPAAVGVALGLPGQRVIALIGDGSSMYSIQALWSAAQARLPITFVILNNGRYAALQDFAPSFGFAPADAVQGTQLPGLDFVSLAKGMGCDALRVSDPDALQQALRSALTVDRPMLLDVEVA